MCARKKGSGFVFDSINNMGEFQEFLAKAGLVIKLSGNVYYLERMRMQKKIKLPRDFGHWHGINFAGMKGTLRLRKGFLSKIKFNSYNYKIINEEVAQMIRFWIRNHNN